MIIFQTSREGIVHSEGAILDSKLENVGPTLSSLLCAEAYA